MKPEAHLSFFYWAADGRGWIAASRDRIGSVLLYVDLEGRAHPVWDLKGDTSALGMPSPDGRHLAIVVSCLSWKWRTAFLR